MSEICPPDTPQDYLNCRNMLRSTVVTFVTLCLLVALCGSFPMCTDGQPPLMEANDAFPCSRGCPRGFFCEMQDSRQTPILGICCANRTELQLLYGSNNRDQADPIWNDDDVRSKHKPPALPLLQLAESTHEQRSESVARYESGATTEPQPSGSVRVIAVGVETIATTTLSSTLEAPANDIFETNSTTVPQSNNTLHVFISSSKLSEKNPQPEIVPASSETNSSTLSPYDSANSDTELLLKEILKGSEEATFPIAETNATLEVGTFIENPVTEEATTRPTDSTLPTPLNNLFQQRNSAVGDPISVNHQKNPAPSVENVTEIEEVFYDAGEITQVESPENIALLQAKNFTEGTPLKEKLIENPDEEPLKSFEKAVKFTPELKSVLSKSQGFRKKDIPPAEPASHESILLEYISKKEGAAQKINNETTNSGTIPIPDNLKVSTEVPKSIIKRPEEEILPELVEILRNDPKSDDIAEKNISSSTSDQVLEKGEVSKENLDGSKSPEVVDITKNSKGSEERQIAYSCDRQKYEFFCQSSNVRTQPKIRWYLNEHGECDYYPWGYCPGDRVVDSITIRTKQECMRECLDSGSREKDILDHIKDFHPQTGPDGRQLEKIERRQEDQVEHLENKNDEAVGPFIPFPLEPGASQTEPESSLKSTSFEEPKEREDAKPQDTGLDLKENEPDPYTVNTREILEQGVQKEVLDTSAKEEIFPETGLFSKIEDDEGKVLQLNSEESDKQNGGKDVAVTANDASSGDKDEKTTVIQAKRPIQFDGEPSQGIKYQYPLKMREQIQCTGTKYRYLCKNGMPSQFVYRWAKVSGKCSSFPYGYCLSEWNHPHPRTQAECEHYCPS